MTHVPVELAARLFESFASFYAVGITAAVCASSSTTLRLRGLLSFDTQANMDAYFQYLVDKYAVPQSGLSCDADLTWAPTPSAASRPASFCVLHPSRGHIPLLDVRRFADLERSRR